MDNYHDPHAEIVEVGFFPLEKALVNTIIGQSEISITLVNENPVFVRPQSASFLEKRDVSGNWVEQEFDAVFTDDASANIQGWREKVDVDCLVAIRYTNGKTIVAGTDMAPVRCEVEHSGSPRTTHISFKRNSPEFAKVLQSLS